MYVVDVVITVLLPLNFCSLYPQHDTSLSSTLHSCFYSFLSVAASPDDINHVDQKEKCGEDDKAKHFGYDKHDGM